MRTFWKTNLHLETCVAFRHVETTGLDPASEEVIQFSAVKFVNGEQTEELNLFCNPGKPISPFISELTRIDDAMVKDQPSCEEKGWTRSLPFSGVIRR
ncbi:MAG: exonuclease domain-containing protein [Candidatus Marinimicrobia bacterium]|nr:exonuclease domain-containing protein [Candidatus Neomarinimicrobiota bacterium]